jgi:hypothetical protein
MAVPVESSFEFRDFIEPALIAERADVFVVPSISHKTESEMRAYILNELHDSV